MLSTLPDICFVTNIYDIVNSSAQDVAYRNSLRNKSSMTPINVQLSSMTPINANQRKISCGTHSWSTLSNIGFTKYVHLRPRHAECRRCGRYIWGTFRFRKMGRKFLQGKQLLLWSGFTGTAFYISIRYVAFLKKNQILQRCISGQGWKPGSGEGNDSQGQWGGALGEISCNIMILYDMISYNRWYLAKSEVTSCCWDAAVVQGFALIVIKPSSFCLVSASCLWDLNDVALVVVVVEYYWIVNVHVVVFVFVVEVAIGCRASAIIYRVLEFLAIFSW